MPKRISKNSMDVNQSAFQMVGTEPKVSSSDVSRVMAAMGRKGGRIGGKRRLETMTPEERREVAVKAAKSRWSKRDKKI